MLAGVLAVGEQPGGLDHHLRTQVVPGERRRVTLGKDPKLVAIHPQPGVRGLHLPRKRPVVGVVLEQMRGRLGIRDVVGGHPLDVRSALVRGPEDIAADTSEPVDPDPYRHALQLLPDDTNRQLAPRPGPAAAPKANRYLWE